MSYSITTCAIFIALPVFVVLAARAVGDPGEVCVPGNHQTHPVCFAKDYVLRDGVCVKYQEYQGWHDNRRFTQRRVVDTRPASSSQVSFLVVMRGEKWAALLVTAIAVGGAVPLISVWQAALRASAGLSDGLAYCTFIPHIAAATLARAAMYYALAEC